MTITFVVSKNIAENDVNLEYMKPFEIDDFIWKEYKRFNPLKKYYDIVDELTANGVPSDQVYDLAEQKEKEQAKNLESKIDGLLKQSIILKTSCSDDLKIVRNKLNSFVYSAWEAYNLHYHLIIRPDNIWMAIMTQFSFYVNKNSEELRDKFVDFKEKKTLEVFTNYPILEAPFDKLTMDMSNQISKNIKDPSIRDWIIPSFSTTTESDKVVFASVLMSTMKKYMDYKMTTRCGLPRVTMQGEIEDWINLKERVTKLLEFNNKENHMNKWVNYLLPVMDNFIKSACGTPDTDWWNQIVDYRMSSGGNSLSGWLSVFCVFDNDGKFEDNHKTRSINQGPSIWPKVDDMSISNGYVSSPVLLTDADGTQYKSQLYAGHFASRVQDKTSIIPSLDWFIVANMDL